MKTPVAFWVMVGFIAYVFSHMQWSHLKEGNIDGFLDSLSLHFITVLVGCGLVAIVYYVENTYFPSKPIIKPSDPLNLRDRLKDDLK